VNGIVLKKLEQPQQEGSLADFQQQQQHYLTSLMVTHSKPNTGGHINLMRQTSADSLVTTWQQYTRQKISDIVERTLEVCTASDLYESSKAVNSDLFLNSQGSCHCK
jgi:hypothetical protein